MCRGLCVGAYVRAFLKPASHALWSDTGEAATRVAASNELNITV